MIQASSFDPKPLLSTGCHRLQKLILPMGEVASLALAWFRVQNLVWC